MKVSIEKELEKKSQKEKIKFEIDPINEVKLLLSGDSSEDLRILKGLSNQSQLNRVEKIRGQQMELEKIENDYEGKVYKIEQIKKLAIDYRLRFLSSQRYTGTFDIEVTSKIKEFAKSANVQLSPNTLERSFYILAPQEMFALQDEKYVTKKQLDPAIFYKIDDNHYRLIHKWGDDFTIFRLISGFRYRSWWMHQLFNTVMVLPIVALIMGGILGVNNIANHPIISGFLTIALSFIFAYFRWGYGKHDGEDQIDGFFGPENWDSTSRIYR